MTSPVLQSALWYATHKRWQVIPLHSPVSGICSCKKSDCTSPAKHPWTQHGLDDASRDPTVINQWWSTWPHANAGIVTGVKSGLFVLDVDDKNGGMDTIATLPVIPDTAVCLTGGGGLHYFFNYPQSKTLRNSSGLLGPGLDTRGEGGYVVASPSLHISGNNYAWEVSCRPDSVEIADVPNWMLDMLLRPSDTRKHSEPVEGLIVDGVRDNTLTSMAGTMRRRGFSERSILAALLVENEDRVVPPLGEAEVKRIAQSVGRYVPDSTNGNKAKGAFK